MSWRAVGGQLAGGCVAAGRVAGSWVVDWGAGEFGVCIWRMAGGGRRGRSPGEGVQFSGLDVGENGGSRAW